MNDDPLGQTNRFVIVVAALVVIFLALLLTLLAWGAPAENIARLSRLAGWLQGHNDRETKAIITLGALVVTLAMLTAIVVELTPAPKRSVRVHGAKSGAAAITTDEIADRIDDEVGRIEHIVGCRATVIGRGKRVDVVLDLHVDAGADLSHTADDACRRAQTVVEQELGIALTQLPRARLHYRELRLREHDAPPEGMRRQPGTGWERPGGEAEGERDQRRQPDAPEEAQA